MQFSEAEAIPRGGLIVDFYEAGMENRKIMHEQLFVSVQKTLIVKIHI